LRGDAMNLFSLLDGALARLASLEPPPTVEDARR
jgi:hypothetical protein